jgi:BirA family biotin operon repressor/biotin-[acetyl-CoA-carboxylase] ligase
MKTVFYSFQTIDSTNTWAKQHLEDFSKEDWVVVVADEQTAGRGRFKRKWISPPKQNLYMTFCFFCDRRGASIGNIPQVLALSAAHLLQSLGFFLQFKWPNDLLLADKKLGGILCETVPLQKGLWVIAGIGINVNMPLEELVQIDQPATSLGVEGGQQLAISSLANALNEQFQNDMERFWREGFKPFIALYRERIGAIGKQIRFRDHERIWEGTLYAIEEDGTLILQVDGGATHRFISGEIISF